MKTLFKMPIGVGICSLVMMFIALTMASIMSLTLMTSYRDGKLTKRRIAINKAYYAAEAKANRRLLEIEEIYDIYYSTPSSREDVLEQALEEIEGIKQIKLGEESIVSYEVPINDRQSIEVVLTMALKEDDTSTKELEQIGEEEMQPITLVETPSGALLQLTSWRVQSSTSWDYEEESFSDVSSF